MNGTESTESTVDQLPLVAQTAAVSSMASNSISQPPCALQEISADEIALYDRQIRLWGMRAQEMIRKANILLIGVRALGNEIAKNLTLAGIGSLTILDDQPVTDDDLGAQFLVNEEDIGTNRAEAAAVELKKMNPRVSVIADTQSVLEKLPEYFSAFQIVICTCQPFELASTINISCRMYNTRFYAADIHGMYGYIFSDLIMHSFSIEREQSNRPTQPGTKESATRTVVSVQVKKDGEKSMETVTKQETYCPLMLANSSPLAKEMLRTRRTKLQVTPLLSCLRTLFDIQKHGTNLLKENPQKYLQLFTQMSRDKHLELQLPLETLTAEFLRSFIQNLGTELTPTAAYLGGQLAQDVINVLGEREQPIQNLLLFDGEDFKSPIYSMQPILDPTLTALPLTNGAVADLTNVDISSSTIPQAVTAP